MQYSKMTKNQDDDNQPHEEIIFHFTNQNIDLKLLTRKIVEYLKINWCSAESRYNDAIEAFEIVTLKEKNIPKFPWESGEEYLIIKGMPNDFTIKFFLHKNGYFVPRPRIGSPAVSIIEPMLKQNNRLEFLKMIEEIVYTFSDTSVDFSNTKLHDT